MTGSHHERLAELMDARRLELGMTWEEVASAAGIKPPTLRAIRNGTNRPSPLTARGLDKAMSWTPGSVEAILDGGEPTLAGPYAHLSNVRITTTRAPAEDEDDEDPKMKRATELLAEAQALLEEIRRERREGA